MITVVGQWRYAELWKGYVSVESCFIGYLLCFGRSESLEVLTSLAIDNIVEVYSRPILIVFFVDVILAGKELEKESIMLRSSRNSPHLKMFDIGLEYSLISMV